MLVEAFVIVSGDILLIVGFVSATPVRNEPSKAGNFDVLSSFTKLSAVLAVSYALDKSLYDFSYYYYVVNFVG
jgi:hypothetical protein